MPVDQEKALREAARKLARSGKLHRKPGQSMADAEDSMVYGTLTNMQKRGSVKPWRKLKK